MAQIIQQGQHWCLGGEVIFANVSELLKTSVNFDNTKPVLIDFAQVTDVDTSAISLMLEWKRRAISVKSEVKFINLSENLMSLAHLYGVSEVVAPAPT